MSFVTTTESHPAGTFAPVKKGDQHRRLQKELLRCTLTADALDELLQSLSGCLLRFVPAVSLLYFGRDADGQLDEGRQLHKRPPAALDAEVFSQLQTACSDAAQSGEVEIRPLIDARFVVFAVPVALRDRAPDVIGVLSPALDSTERPSVLLQMLASHIVLWHVLRDGLQGEQLAGDSAAIVELLAEIARASNVAEAAQQVADNLADYWGCRQVAVGLAANTASRCRVTGISGSQQFDAASQSVEAIEAAMDEAIVRTETLCWSNRDADIAVGGLAHKRLGERQHAQAVLTVPLKHADDEISGAICVVDLPPEQMDRARRLLEAAATPLANALAASRKHSRGKIGKWTQLLGEHLRGRTGRFACAIAVCLCAASFLPLPYQVECECQIEPVTRRFVVAPFAGTLDTLMVEPGEVVQAGDLLATMDARELKWKKASLVADRNQALKRRDSAQASGSYADQQIAQLEAERLALEIELLDHRIANLEIKSPVAGIVVAGTKDWAEGAPLEIGQSLFEIAPLEEMTVEMAVPDNEVSYVEVGQSVRVRLESLPSSDQSLHLQRIQPRSEIRDKANVFIAEAPLDNADGLLRPGMKGRAKITTPRQPIYWIVFHKPWQLLRKYLF